MVKGSETRYYVHGDLMEDRPGFYFCSRCDLSEPKEHFDDAAHVATRVNQYQYSMNLWKRTYSKGGYRRPDHAVNLLAEAVENDIEARRNSESAFYRWLMRQDKRDDIIGDLASDARGDKRFPFSASRLEEVRTYLKGANACADALVALDEAWEEFNSKSKVRAGLTQKLRFEIFKRDNYRCQICGRAGSDCRLEVDHKVPVSKGGGNAPTNLWTLCLDCNRGKRDSYL